MSARSAAAKQFQQYLKMRGIQFSRKTALPWGTFPAYLKATPDLAARLKSPKERDRHRRWLLRAVHELREHGEAPEFAIANKLPRDSGYGKDGPVQESHRYRHLLNQGRPFKAPMIREALFEWFSYLRVSTACKVRVPRKLVQLKASALAEEYTRECLLRGVKPDPPLINSHWIRRWMRQFRISLRRPNKRYKVPLAVLQERLQIFWLNLVRLRTFIRMVSATTPI